ncbi:MAG: mreC [Herminiimonas sp.]|nr:mreC [Herminiimonas sp.]
MEYSPPPLFKQGASARVKVIVFAFIAICLLIVDARLRTLSTIRQVVGVGLYPLQVAALMPRDALYSVGGYFTSVSRLENENRKLRGQQVQNAQMLQQGQQLLAENAQLRKLLSAGERLPVKSVMSEIMYDTRDAFTRKIVLDRGSRNAIALGQPVIDDVGVVGQVTRVFPFTSEVTLLTDKDHAISVQVLRSGLRSVAYGRGQSGVLDLRFMAANADIRKGDILVTSGIDGVYPPGLAVATVTQVENKSSDAFAHIVCQPTAGIDRNKQLLILLQDATLAPRPDPEESRDKKGLKGKKRAAAKDSKDASDVADSPTGKEPAGAANGKPAAVAGALPAAAGALGAANALAKKPQVATVESKQAAPKAAAKQGATPSVAPTAPGKSTTSATATAPGKSTASTAVTAESNKQPSTTKRPGATP